MRNGIKRESTQAIKRVAGSSAERLFTEVVKILEDARRRTARSVNTHMVTAYWLIGQRIVEAEQGGKKRADYGARLIENLSSRLKERFGKGFSVQSLWNFRDLFLTYRERMHEILSPAGRESTLAPATEAKLSPAGRESSAGFHPNLGWSHYRALMRVEKPEARDFYEQEAAVAGWSKRELERQIGSLYYERLLMSRDKKGMLKEQRRKTSAADPLGVIKDPYVLEFLDLPEDHRLNETQLEERLISRMQQFLLELGHGFAFIGRQQRLTLDGDHFYADLVFYHVRLKCYVIIDLKAKKLTHADLGQMQLYVNYFDQEVAGVGDNPTLGLILCTDKNDAVVRYILGKERRKIFASRYKMELPTEAVLAAEMRREMRLLGVPKAKASPGNRE